MDINSALGLAKPGYSRCVYIGVVAGAFAALVLLAMSLVPSTSGSALARILADELLGVNIRKALIAIEGKLPTSVSRSVGMLLVTSSPISAVEEVTATLLPSRSLRTWTGRVLAGRSSQGEPFLVNAHLDASRRCRLHRLLDPKPPPAESALHLCSIHLVKFMGPPVRSLSQSSWRQAQGSAPMQFREGEPRGLRH